MPLYFPAQGDSSKCQESCSMWLLESHQFVLSQRKCVSWGDQGHFFGGVVSNLGLIVVRIPQWFLGRLDVALGLRVNQYKPVCAISLSLELFNFSLYLWTGINNRLFLRNNRLFFWCCAKLLCVFGKLNYESSFLKGISF